MAQDVIRTRTVVFFALLMFNDSDRVGWIFPYESVQLSQKRWRSAAQYICCTMSLWGVDRSWRRWWDLIFWTFEFQNLYCTYSLYVRRCQRSKIWNPEVCLTPNKKSTYFIPPKWKRSSCWNKNEIQIGSDLLFSSFCDSHATQLLTVRNKTSKSMNCIS